MAVFVMLGDAPRTQSLEGWDDETHGRDATPDYARVFPRDRVNRLDIQVSAENWQTLMADMASMAGPFGRGGGSGPGGFPPLIPPPEAIAACAGKIEGDACSFGNPPFSGRCAQFGAAGVACAPLMPDRPGGDGPGGGQGADDVEFLPRTPVYVQAAVVFDRTLFRSVGLRLKGNSSLMNAWGSGIEKLPFRLNFDEFEKEVPAIRDQTFFGFPNLNLTNNAMDASFLRAKVVGDLLQDAGVPSARTAFVRVYLDRGAGPVYLGLYTLVEVPDRPMLVREFGSDDGNLYKPRGAGARWTTFARESFPKKTNVAAEDWTDVQEAIAALNASRADAAAWRARLEARFEVNGFLRWLAFNTVIGNHDVYGGLSPHNYYLYGSPRHRDRLHWIPWDHDLAMVTGPTVVFTGGGPAPGPMPPGEPPPGAPGGSPDDLDLFHEHVNDSWPLIRFLLDDPVYRAAYRRHVEDVLSGPFEPARVSARLRAEHALIARDVVGPEGEGRGRTFLRSPQDFDEALYGTRGLLTYVQSRHAAVREALGAAR